MEIRRATPSDVGRLANIAVDAFANEPIYARFFPNRVAFPDDYRRSLARSYASFMRTPRHIIMVATSKNDAGHEVVCGFASFIRRGKINAERWTKWNPDTWKMWLHRMFQWLEGLMVRDRSIDSRTLRSYYDQAAMVRDEQDESFIDFRTLAVDPLHQRLGYGEKLVEWCGIRAVQDKVPVYGDATAVALPLYVRNGCKDVGKIILEGSDAQREANSVQTDTLHVVVLRWDSSALEDLVKDHLDFSAEN